MKTQVKDLLKAPVVTTVMESNTGYVRELMERKDVGAIPVIEMHDDEIIIRGIVTSSDICGVTDESTPVDMIMSKKVHVIRKNASIQAAAKMMLRHHVHHLVVIEEGRIIGMISSMDFVELLADQELTGSNEVMFW
jgi:CBS domain-containing protein